MLNKWFPHMYDSPERNQAVAGLVYGVVPFIVLPFTLILLILDSNNTQTYVKLEFLYQIINFISILVIFRTYLQDSWLNVTISPKKFWPVCLGAAVAICAIFGAYTWAGFRALFPDASLVALGAMPMTGIELMLVPGDFLLLDGSFLAAGLLILLGPVITACLFYAPVFAPLSVAGHRLGAYLGVAAWLAVPRIITYCTIWGGWKEPQLYLAQLPIHFIACWTYQKTDTVWAPIFTHAIANAVCCAALFGLKFLGYIT